MQSYKKTMILAAVLLAGCQKYLFPGGPRYLREPQAGHHQTQGAAAGAKDSAIVKRLYITALCGKEAVLFADGKEIARGPSDHDRERHRAREGHLWTDIVQGKETIIFRDGKEWLRLDGEEFLAGFLIDKGKLHTLGQRPGNGGICYRIDGKVVFSAPAGRIVGAANSPHWDAGAFSADSSGIYYAYGIPFVHSGHTTWEYRIMKGPDTILTLPDDASGTVLDLRVFGGKVYRVVRSGSLLRFLCGDTVLWSWGLDVKDVLSGVRIVCLDGGICLEYTTSRERYSDLWLIREDGRQRMTYYGYDSPHILRKGPVTAAWTEFGGIILNMVLGGKPLPAASGMYHLATPLCLNAFDSTFVAVLSDTSLTHHLVLTDTLSTPIRLSGVPTSIRIE